MNNIAVAKETIKITAEKQYEFNGNTVNLPDLDYKNVIVYSPKAGEELLKMDISPLMGEKMCRIIINNKGSFETASQLEKPFVMNFANAHKAGGGFLLGANAQEEALCRCSTLYASINSAEAKKTYRYNNSHISSVESDYMLLSPDVCVFRDDRCQLLDKPFMVSVVTSTAPNRNGGAMFTSKKKINETITRRIRIILRIAIKNGHRNLVLGAWGCGAFRNKPDDVAECFRKVLVDEEYGKCFDEVYFAIRGRIEGYNYTTFKRILES